MYSSLPKKMDNFLKFSNCKIVTKAVLEYVFFLFLFFSELTKKREAIRKKGKQHLEDWLKRPFICVLDQQRSLSTSQQDEQSEDAQQDEQSEDDDEGYDDDWTPPNGW